jgi:hypothetical protein
VADPPALARPDASSTSGHSASADGALQFVDRQQDAGVTFTHSDGGSGRHYYIEQIGSGCAFIDYDNDGLPDIFAVSGKPLPGYKKTDSPRCELWHNLGGGRFEKVTDKAGLGLRDYGFGVCAADYDNDGYVDLFVTCNGGNHLFHNERNGTFKDVTIAAGVRGMGGISTSACFFDADNDGWVDLYVCHYVRWNIKEDRWCGKEQTKKSYCGPEVYPANPDTLLHNNHDGTFTDVSQKCHIIQPRSKSLGVVSTDVNGDGWQDLYVACDLEPNLLLVNNGDGTFHEDGIQQAVAFGMDGAAEAGMGVTAGDYDNDGRMDLFVTNYSFEMNALYRNAGHNFFTYESQRTAIGPPSLVPLAFGTHFGDFDNDGWQDVVVANGHVLDDCHEQNQALEYAQAMDLYMNRQGKTFDHASRRAGPAFQAKYVGRGLAVGDYDRDGKLDVLVNNINGPLRLIHNESGNIGNWIGIDLQGTKSNRSAIGARVKIKTAAGWQMQEVASGSSYLSQSEFHLHFGIGTAREIEQAVVQWPGSGGKPGPTGTWAPLEANKTHALKESAGHPGQGDKR